MAPIDRIAQTLRDALRGAISDSGPELNTAAQQAKPDVEPALQSVFGGGGFSVGTIIDLIGALGGGLGGGVALFGELAGKLSEWVVAIGSGWAIGSFFVDALRPVWLEITHGINNAIQSEIFDPNTAATLESKGIIDNAFGRSEAAGGNLAGDHYDKLALAAQDRPDASSLLDMLNRAEITNADALEALRHHGFPPDWAAHIVALRRVLLSPADLALANLRGNIDDNFLNTYAASLGVTQADMQVLIGNTGEPPGAQELMEALRRGFIPDDRFDHGIRQSRYRNEWLDVFHKLRFRPMSTSDAVRAVVQNHLTFDQGLAVALQNGLEQQDFRTLVESAGRPLSHEQMMTLFHRGEATREEVDQALRESDIKDKYKDKAFELGRRLIPERTIVSMVNHGVLPHDQGVSLLRKLGFADADIEHLIALGVSERKNAHKELSRSDIVSLYSDKLIKRTEARDELIKLGYTQADAVELLDMSDFKHKTTELKLKQRGVEATLKAGHITTHQAKDRLIDEGMTSEDAQTLVDVWTLHKSAPSKQLTQAQVLKLATENLITLEQCHERLLSEGLVDRDAELLMQLHGLLPPGFIAP